MKYRLLLTLLSVVMLSFPVSAQRKTIICLTYDDALDSHLGTVIPQLDAAGFKGTFFLPSIEGASSRIGEASPVFIGWRNAALNGHELANHTLFHPCPEKLGWQKQVAIESYSLEKILREIQVQSQLLGLLDTTRKERAFAFPCNITTVAGIDYSAIIHKKGLVTFGRGGGDSNSVVKDVRSLNPRLVPSWLVEEGTSTAQLIAFAGKAKKSGGMAVYQFHGIGAEFFRVTAETHKAFLDYLVNHQADYEVLTFSAAMQRISAGSVKR